MTSAIPRLSLGQFIRRIAEILAGKPQVPDALAGNQLLHILYGRRSIRRFRQEEIPNDVFTAILEAGRLAPSTVNMQSWSFATFTAETWRETFDHIIPFRAQRAVIVMADMHRARAVLETFPDSPLVEFTVAVMNASLAAMNMNIAAEALGVASVMLSETSRSGLLDTGHLKEKLNLPEGVIPLMTIVFGYPAVPPPPMPPRLPLQAISFPGAYRETDPQVLQDWLAQMNAGYKAQNPSASLEKQLEVYRSKFTRAEEDLKAMVYERGKDCADSGG